MFENGKFLSFKNLEIGGLEKLFSDFWVGQHFASRKRNKTIALELISGDTVLIISWEMLLLIYDKP